METAANARSTMTSPGSISTYFTVTDYVVKSVVTNLLVERQTVGDQFILDHPTNSKLDGTYRMGTGQLGSYSTVEEQNLSRELAPYGLQNIAGWIAQETGLAGPTYIQVGSLPSDGVMLAWTDSVDAWAASGQATTLAISTTTHVGKYTLSHAKAGSGTTATVTSTVMDVLDISDMRYILIAYYVPTVTGGSLSQVALRISDGSSNYMEFVPASSANGWNYKTFDMTSPTSSSGTLDTSAIETVAFTTTCSASGATYSGFLLGPVYSYPLTTLTPSGGLNLPLWNTSAYHGLGLPTTATNYTDQMSSLVLDVPLHAGSANDRSASGYNGTISGATATTGNTGQATEALLFDGVDDYVEFADQTALRMTAGGTICAWIFPYSAGETRGRVIDKSTASSGTDGYHIGISTSNRLAFNVNGGTDTLSSNDAITFNQWNFIAVTFNGSGRALYVNGVNVTASGAAETAVGPNVSGAVRIGNRAGATDRTFDGKICKVKLFNTVLSTEELATLAEEEPFKRVTHSAQYSETGRISELGLKTQSWWKKRWNSAVLGLWDQGDGTDSSTNDNDISLTGATVDASDPFGETEAISFDGTNDYGTVSATTETDTSSFITFAAWVYNSAGGTTSPTIMSKGTIAANGQYLWIYTGGTNESTLNIDIGSATTDNAFDFEGFFPLDKWVHLCVVIDNSTKYLYLYKNGFLYETKSLDIDTNNLASNTAIYFGAKGGASDYFEGSLYQIMWSNRLFSEQETRMLAWGDLFAWKDITPFTTDTTYRYKFSFEVTIKNESAGRSRVTHQGIGYVRDALANSFATSPRYVEWNDSQAHASVFSRAGTWDMGSGNEDRNAWSTTIVRDRNQVRYISNLSRSELNSVSIRKTGLFNASSSDTLFAETEYGAIGKDNTFKVVEEGKIRFI